MNQNEHMSQLEYHVKSLPNKPFLPTSINYNICKEKSLFSLCEVHWTLLHHPVMLDRTKKISR